MFCSRAILPGFSRVRGSLDCLASTRYCRTLLSLSSCSDPLCTNEVDAPIIRPTQLIESQSQLPWPDDSRDILLYIVIDLTHLAEKIT
jgi:hypothetical protein